MVGQAPGEWTGIKIGVDFDGTIVENDFPRIGKPVDGAISALKYFQRVGATLILWTVRDGKYLAEAVAYLKENDVVCDQVNPNPPNDFSTSIKLYCDVLIDDQALGAPLIWPMNGAAPYINWNMVRVAIPKRVSYRLSHAKRNPERT